MVDQLKHDVGLGMSDSQVIKTITQTPKFLQNLDHWKTWGEEGFQSFSTIWQAFLINHKSDSNQKLKRHLCEFWD